MNRKVRLDRLGKLAFMLHYHAKLFPKIEWDMNTFCRPENGCKFAACALGSAACYAPFKKSGLKMRPSHFSTGKAPSYNGEQDYEAGREFFGISLAESCWLFGPWNYKVKGGNEIVHEAITTKMVARRVEKLIKHYTAHSEPMIEHLNFRHVSGAWTHFAVPANTKQED